MEFYNRGIKVRGEILLGFRNIGGCKWKLEIFIENLRQMGSDLDMWFSLLLSSLAHSWCPMAAVTHYPQFGDLKQQEWILS